MCYTTSRPIEPASASAIEILLEQLRLFTGDGWEQEDDVTLVTQQRLSGTQGLSVRNPTPVRAGAWRRKLTSSPDQTQPGNGLRYERNRYVWVHFQPEPLRCSIKQVYKG